MAFFCVTTCPGCKGRFRVVWRLAESKLVPSAVIRLTCPLCGHRFDRALQDLQMFADGAKDFPAGFPVRHMKLIYDCPLCGKSSVAIRSLFGDWRDKELLQQVNHIKCDNPGCTGKRKPVEASVSRIVSA